MKNLGSSFSKLLSWQVRYLSGIKKAKNHYDSLGLTPKSTQTEIKSAYYKLSMVYHPDKNKDEASLEKFRDITEAYEVLGNVKTRRLYDKGLYFQPGIRSRNETVDKFHKSRETRSKPPPPDGRTPIYDFDEWAKTHYGEAFRRKMENKKREHEYQFSREKAVIDKKVESVVFTIVILLGLGIVFSSKSDYDHVNLGTLGILPTKKDPEKPKD